jgi:hypothetical protein
MYIRYLFLKKKCALCCHKYRIASQKLESAKKFGEALAYAYMPYPPNKRSLYEKKYSRAKHAIEIYYQLPFSTAA